MKGIHIRRICQFHRFYFEVGGATRTLAISSRNANEQPPISSRGYAAVGSTCSGPEVDFELQDRAVTIGSHREETRGKDTEYRDTCECVRSSIDEGDRIVGAIEERFLALGRSKAELVRRVGVAPEPGLLLCVAGLFDSSA